MNRPVSRASEHVSRKNEQTGERRASEHESTQYEQIVSACHRGGRVHFARARGGPPGLFPNFRPSG